MPCKCRAGGCHYTRVSPAPYIDEAVSSWGDDYELEPLVDQAVCRQKAWDNTRSSVIADHLLSVAANEEERARLLAVSTKESGAWLRALPVSAYGLRMDDSAVRVAVGLLCVVLTHASTVGHTWTHLGDTLLTVSEARVVTSDIRL